VAHTENAKLEADYMTLLKERNEIAAERDRYETALRTMVNFGADIAELAEHFITSGDVRGLQKTGKNVRSVARAALEEGGDDG
jgi:hypothetical protein